VEDETNKKEKEEGREEEILRSSEEELEKKEFKPTLFSLHREEDDDSIRLSTHRYDRLIRSTSV